MAEIVRSSCWSDSPECVAWEHDSVGDCLHLCLCYMLFTSMFSPYIADDDDIFCTLCNFVLTAILFLCLLFKTLALAEDMKPWMTDEMRSSYAIEDMAGAIFVGPSPHRRRRDNLHCVPDRRLRPCRSSTWRSRTRSRSFI